MAAKGHRIEENDSIRISVAANSHLPQSCVRGDGRFRAKLFERWISERVGFVVVLVMAFLLGFCRKSKVEIVKNLAAKTWVSLVALTVVMGLLLFLPAGTLRYWQAWVYLGIFAGASGLISVYLLRKDPALLERRMRGGPTAEKETVQKIIMLFTSAGFIALLVVPALDYRFGWSAAPFAVVIAGDSLVAVGFYFIFLVYKENTFTSATIEIAENQKVISTGPYALVRHPMYASGLLYFAGTPLALGSYWGLAALAFVMPFLIWRLMEEEKFLAKRLRGYVEYQKQVRHHLVPYVW
jgi:protein-S-isoprenylcysteine O-methyltransferase Ste14